MAVSAVRILARRFLLSKVSDRFLSFIAWVSVIGVALGVLALTVVTSVINGFESELARVITGMNGDVILYTRGDPIEHPERVRERIREVLPNVQAISGTFITELMVAGPNGVAGAVLEGIRPDEHGKVTAVPERVTDGRLARERDEVTLGYAIAEKIGAKVGDQVRLIAPFAGEGGSEQEEQAAAKARLMTVSGIFRMGMYDYDSKFVFSTLETVQLFLAQPGKITALKIRLQGDPSSTQARRASDRLSKAFGYPFRAKDWGQLNQNLFYAIELEKAVIAIILTAIVIVAAFNVVSTLMMMIHDKTREIAILKAMGFRPSQSFRLFCLIGMGIGTIGITVGVGLGLVINWVLEKTHWIDLPPQIYYIGFLPVVVRWQEIGLIALVAILITFAATLYPALQVSRRSPLEGLRYE